MASITDVCNRALQKLGAPTIANISDSNPSARACNTAYSMVRQSELRKNDWSFAIKRVSLAADSPAPDWGRQNSFTLPSDWLRLTNSYPELLTTDINVVGVTVAYSSQFTGVKDWVIEGKKIVTNDSSPLLVRYIADITDTSQWDSLFVESTATSLAFQICEVITQSNTKKAALAQEYKVILNDARLTNSIEVAPADPPPDTWLACRN